MRNFSATPREMIASVWRYRELVKVASKREVLGRYRGSVLGILWSFFNPLLMLTVYTFVFGFVFNARWSVGSESKIEFALLLFAGLLVFNLFAECINRAPTLVTGNPNYVKKVIYPLETLPVVGVLCALFHGLISLLVWLLVYVIAVGLPHASALYLPLIILPWVLLILGVSWVLAALGVFLRDISQLIGAITTILMFLSPIFYPATALPENLRHLLYLNPLTTVIEQTRAVLFWGNAPDFQALGLLWVASALIAWLGFACFQKTRKVFADVL
ncbi:ABC transporter permease [Pseudomonas sp. TE3786]